MSQPVEAATSGSGVIKLLLFVIEIKTYSSVYTGHVGLAILLSDVILKSKSLSQIVIPGVKYLFVSQNRQLHIACVYEHS